MFGPITALFGIKISDPKIINYLEDHVYLDVEIINFFSIYSVRTHYRSDSLRIWYDREINFL